VSFIKIKGKRTKKTLIKGVLTLIKESIKKLCSKNRVIYKLSIKISGLIFLSLLKKINGGVFLIHLFRF